MAISNPGPGHSGTAGSLNSVPLPQKQTLSSNYLDLASTSNEGWAQQYLPDLMEREAEVFGNRTISGFLSQVGAEEAMTADQVVWSEQGRLHLSYIGKYDNGENTFTITTDIDGNAIASGSGTEHGVRENDQVMIALDEGVIKCLVTNISNDVIKAVPYEDADGNDPAAFTDTTVPSAANATMLVFGSEWGKGLQGQSAVTNGPKTTSPVFKSFNNKPIIIKDY